ncbi:hypothetical protein D3C72_1977580 [compost metagenome]
MHAQVGDAGARLLAGFQIQQKGIAVGLDGAQLVQLGVKAVGDHTAVAHQGGGLFGDGGLQQAGAALGRLQVAEDLNQIGLQRLSIQRE